MAKRETFRGYGPEQGYEFLRRAIAENDYRSQGIEVADDEVFVSDGSKCDCGNILDILGPQNKPQKHQSSWRYRDQKRQHQDEERPGKCHHQGQYTTAPS